jgi:ribosomal protein L35
MEPVDTGGLKSIEKNGKMKNRSEFKKHEIHEEPTRDSRNISRQIITLNEILSNLISR